MERLRDRISELKQKNGNLLVMTGAGISAESGIPTFRGQEGYWTIGSSVYQPEEMATNQMFSRKPWDVWKWYLYRARVCQDAEPNAGHDAIAGLERFFGERFHLITQNVDGLHLRAGSSTTQTYQIHGHIFSMRCQLECTGELLPLPGEVIGATDDALLKAQLRCPHCGSMTRPHVLWFDEYYNEKFYRFDSALAAAQVADLLLNIGSAGTTNLPNQVAYHVLEHGGTIVDINPAENRFSRMAEQSAGGLVYRRKSAEALHDLIKMLL